MAASHSNLRSVNKDEPSTSLLCEGEVVGISNVNKRDEQVDRKLTCIKETECETKREITTLLYT